MTASSYRKPAPRNQYAPVYSTLSIYGTRSGRPSLFSERRNMRQRHRDRVVSGGESPSGAISISSGESSGLLHPQSSRSSVISVHSSESNVRSDGESEGDESRVNRGVLTHIQSNFLDAGKRVLDSLFGNTEGPHSTSVIDLTADASDDEISHNTVDSSDEQFEISNKRRRLNNPANDTFVSETPSGGVRLTTQLKVSHDPFGWDKWKVSPIGDGATKQEASQYGTRFYKKHTSRKYNGDSALILREASIEKSYLRSIFRGEYEVPKILRDERDLQLQLLEKDRQAANAQNSRLKKSIVDVTQRIRDAIMTNSHIRKARSGTFQEDDDDLIFVKEHKLTSMERKRQDFLNDSAKFDKTILQFKKDFNNYKQLIERRRKIQEETRKAAKPKSLIPQLSDAEVQEVKDTLRRSDNAVLSNKDYFEVRVRDFKTLTPGRWLNDTVIEYVMKIIERDTPKTVAFNSFFYTTLSERGYQGVRRWMKRKKVQITDLDKIFAPINLNQSHWALGLIDIKKKTVNYIDSLSHGPNAMSFAILNDLKKYVVDESKGAIGEDFELNHISCPQQPNGFDCGIYVCLNTWYLSKDAELTFNAKDAAKMRTYICHLMLQDAKS